MYRFVRGARKLDGERSEGAGCPPSGATGQFRFHSMCRGKLSSRSGNTSSIQSAVLGGPRARSDAVCARVLHFRSSISLFLPRATVSGSLLCLSPSPSFSGPFSRISIALHPPPPIWLTDFYHRAREGTENTCARGAKRGQERTAGASSSVNAAGRRCKVHRESVINLDHPSIDLPSLYARVRLVVAWILGPESTRWGSERDLISTVSRSYRCLESIPWGSLARVFQTEPLRLEASAICYHAFPGFAGGICTRNTEPLEVGLPAPL